VGAAQTSVVLGQSLLAAAGHAPSARRSARHCANCGVVESVNVVEVQGDGSYLGKIAGGVVGAMIGSQVGQGRGTTAAEIAGVVGGAVAGNEIEKRVKKTSHYDVTVRLQAGGSQTISYAAAPPFKAGDKVRVENGTLVAD
jgi:outer membrane lipoprotein SlyB